MAKSWLLLQPNTFLIGLPWRLPPLWRLEERSCLASLYEGHITALRANYPLEERGERPGQQLVSQSRSPLWSWYFVISISSSSLSGGTYKLLINHALTEHSTWLSVNFSELSAQRTRGKESKMSWSEGIQNNKRCVGKKHIWPYGICCVIV